MFYDRFNDLCQKKGVKPGTACTEMGLSRSLAAKWKKTGTEKPSTDALQKMSVYFGMSIEEIMTGKTNKAPTPEGERPVSDDEIKFALFGGDGEITDAMFEEVKRFAQMVKLREEAEKKKEQQ